MERVWSGEGEGWRGCGVERVRGGEGEGVERVREWRG